MGKISDIFVMPELEPEDDYYSRTVSKNSDGTPLYANERDSANEEKIKVAFEKAFNCELKKFGMLSAIDFYALRHGRVIAVVEVKNRTYKFCDKPRAIINVRKWLALWLASSGLRMPAIYVVGFSDGEIRWIDAANIKAWNVRMGGTRKIVKSHTDIEPIIDIDGDDMQPLKPNSYLKDVP